MALYPPVILSVDEDKSSQISLRMALAAQGCSVLMAATAEEALAIAASRNLNLILASTSLPDMDILTLMTRLRAHTTAPVIVMSMPSDKPTVVIALEAGASDYVLKPIKMNELESRMLTTMRHAPIEKPHSMSDKIGR